MTTRTDIHRPAAIKADDYDYVCQEYLKIECLGDAIVLQQERAALNAHREHTGAKWSRHDHGGTCMICGNNHCLYTVIYWHREENVYIRVGSTCAVKLSFGNEAEFNRFRKAVKDARKRKAGKEKAKLILEDHGLSTAWTIYEENRDGEPGIWQTTVTIQSMVRDLVRYGSFSEKQIDYLRILIDKIEKWPTVKAEREAERANAEDCPTGRITIAGTIVATDVKDNAWGSRYVMTVKDGRGFLVWGTQPESIGSCRRGAKVTLVATVEPSETDPKFGFFKRPSKAQEISEI